MSSKPPLLKHLSADPIERHRRIEAIYNAALERDTSAQAAFLIEACAGDNDLRREVESLLAAHKQAGSFLETPAIEEHARYFAATGTSEESSAPSLSNLSGRSISQYKILSAIGKGGMGEVWLAEDTQLRRHVALKLLPPKFTTQAVHVRRFKQEAQAVIALNHPNIVTLFDFGQSENGYFMATEFIDGQTLRARLQNNGHSPVGETIEIALSICQALDAAHKMGIVHRDIKPENVMLRSDGLVKVLDFGLAKLQETPGGVFPDLDSASLTAAGVVVGTVSYMSPEQARGEKVDARTDLFSLGVVLYEMLTGQTPFAGQTVSDRIASLLLTEPPPVTGLPFGIGEEMNRLLRLALAKDRAERYDSATAFARDLKTLLRQLHSHSWLDAKAGLAVERSTQTVNQPITKTSASDSNRFKHWPIAALVIILGLSALFGRQFLANRRGKIAPAILFNPKMEMVASWRAELEANHLLMDISPDGNLIAFSKGQNGQTDIFVRHISGEEISVTNDPRIDGSPLWSPDGKELAYLSLNNGRWEVWRIPWLRGTGRMVAALDTRPEWLTRWSADGKHIFFETEGNLFALDADSGNIQQRTKFPRGKQHFSISAREDWLAYEEKVEGVTQIFAAPLAGGGPLQLTNEGEDNRYPAWLPDGKLFVYSSQRNGIYQICLARLDQSEPAKCTFGHENLTPWNVSPDGSKIFYVTERHDSGLLRYDRTTQTEQTVPSGIQLDLYPQFSPVGTPQILFQQIDAIENLFNGVLTVSTANLRTPLPITGFDPRWSPDGKHIAFLHGTGKTRKLRIARKDGAEERTLVQAGVNINSFHNQSFAWNQPANFSWSPADRRIAFSSSQSGVSNIYTIHTETGAEEPRSENKDSAAQLSCPLWSADGTALAYLWERKTKEAHEYRVKIWQAGQTKTLHSSTLPLRMIGWANAGKEFFAAEAANEQILMPVEMKLLRLPVDGGPPVEISRLPAAMFSSVMLTPDRRSAAFISRPKNQDEIRLVTLATRHLKTLLTNRDTDTFFSSLTWSPDQHQLCLSRQSNLFSIWMIENFR